MIQCPFPSSEESHVVANLNNVGNTTSAYNGSELQNYLSYQHHQVRAEQNHENQTTGNQKFDMVESATPLLGSFLFSCRFIVPSTLQFVNKSAQI